MSSQCDIQGSTDRRMIASTDPVHFKSKAIAVKKLGCWVDYLEQLLADDVRKNLFLQNELIK